MANSREVVAFADDTTGALDVAGSFHSRGLDTVVRIDSEPDGLDGQCTV